MAETEPLSPTRQTCTSDGLQVDPRARPVGELIDQTNGSNREVQAHRSHPRDIAPDLHGDCRSAQPPRLRLP
jgi:hypothetical protein